MKITAHECSVAGAYLLKSDAASDERGLFMRSFCAESFKALGLPADFPQQNLSLNPHEGTLRGLHYMQGTPGEYKLVRCVTGRIWDVVADLRKSSPTYGTWWGCELTAESGQALFIPAGCAHGFITLSKDSAIYYLMGCAYRPDDQRGIRYDDPDLNIAWPATAQLISAKDLALPWLKNL